ncbi:MAG: recombination protein RecR, partial [Fimbriimonadales bacterium]|nr:recombination protein RecR [Fimbriimonadales bacterium]
MLFARPLAELVAELERLPGIGPKSAQRLAFHLLRLPDEAAFRLADVIRSAKTRLRFCAQCQNFSEEELCEVCRDPHRDPTVLCVVAEPRDVGAVERINEYRGLYHVLHGLLDPMAGVGPERLRIQEPVSYTHL